MRIAINLMREFEEKVVNLILDAAVLRACEMVVDVQVDNEGMSVKRTMDKDEIFKRIMESNIAWLYLYSPHTDRAFGAVCFHIGMMGNILNDYTVNQETKDILADALELIAKYNK